MGLLSFSFDDADATRWTFKSPRAATRDLWGGVVELPLTSREEQRRQWLHRTLDLMGERSRTKPAWRTPREDEGSNSPPKKKKAKRKAKKQEVTIEKPLSVIRKASRRRTVVLLSHVIIIFQRLLKEQSSKSEKLLKRLESMDILSSSDGEGRQLLFDKTFFKPDKDVQIPTKARNILQKSSEERSLDDLEYLKSALLCYDAITAMPSHMQEQLRKKCWYERFNDKRILIREGQRATYFYFILSGSVVLTKKDPDIESSSHVLHIYGRGDSFGEVALLTGTSREFTVTTKQETELLCMVDKDYNEMFVTSPEDPFLLSVPCLQGWPVEHINHERDKFIFGYFKKGTVLTKSSASSEWIYIVKSGSCSVMKKIMPRCIAVSKQEAVQLPGESHMVMLQRLYRQQVLKASQNAKWLKMWTRPALNIPTRDEEEEVRRTRRTALSIGGRTLSLASVLDSEKKALSREPSLLSASGKNSPLIPAGGPFLVQTGQSGATGTTQPNLTKKRVTLVTEDVEHRLKSLPSIKLPQIQMAKPPKPPGEAMFAVIQTLVPRQHFGFTNQFSDDQPDLALVSNGAEVLMIKRSVFIELAPKHVLQEIREKTFPFPPEVKYHDLLERHLLWHKERQLVLQNVTKEISQKKGKDLLL